MTIRVMGMWDTSRMFLAVTQIPAVPDAFERAAAATGMVRVDVQRRLAGLLPRVVVVDADAAAVRRTQAALEAAGFLTIAFDPQVAPSADERITARTLELGTDAIVVVSGVGAEARQRVPIDAIALLLRATHSATTSRDVTTHDRKLALGTALLTGGLKMTKKVERTTTETTQTQDAVLVLHRTDRGPDIVLSERRLNYQFLGAGLQPSSRANFEATVTRVRALAPRAAFDDRAAKPGFVAGLPVCSADPLDVALYLLQLVHRGR
jgi:hypothetical protein